MCVLSFTDRNISTGVQPIHVVPLCFPLSSQGYCALPLAPSSRSSSFAPLCQIVISLVSCFSSLPLLPRHPFVLSFPERSLGRARTSDGEERSVADIVLLEGVKDSSEAGIRSRGAVTHSGGRAWSGCGHGAGSGRLRPPLRRRQAPAFYDRHAHLPRGSRLAGLLCGCFSVSSPDGGGGWVCFSEEVRGSVDGRALGELRQGWGINSPRGSLPVTRGEDGCAIRTEGSWGVRP